MPAMLYCRVAIAFAAALAGCAIVPERQHALVSGSGGTVATQEISCAALSGSSMPAAAGTLDPRAVRIASWNLHKQGDPGWQADLSSMVAVSDVLLLQEAGLSRELRAVVEQTGMSWILASAFEYRGTEYGVLTASHTAPASACTLRAFEPLLGIPKAALVASFRLQGRDTTLAVVNLHAINFTLGVVEYRTQLDAIGDVLAAHRGPIVLAGDFNTWSDARAEAVQILATRLSLSRVEFAADDRTRFLGRIFDWVYARDAEVIGATVHAVTSSDHNPLAVTLRVR
jgi:endonuclease/exonuclease/phosphatase (EEP) superfamily protein YafD